MSTEYSFLLENESGIAESAVELTDAAAGEAPVLEVVRQIPGCIAQEEPLDLGALSGMEPAKLAYVLYALQAVCIDSAAERLTEQELARFAHSLRTTVRKSLPQEQTAKGKAALYKNLLESEGPTEDDHRLVPMLRGMLSALRDIVFVHDLNGDVVYMTPNGLTAVGFDAQDVEEGLNLYEFVASPHIEVVSDRLEAIGSGAKAPYSIELLAKDGERIPVEIESRMLSTAPEDRERSPIVSIARDLRLERRLQAEIHRLNSRLDALTANAPLGMLVTDADGLICDANFAADMLLGAPAPKKLIGLRITELGEQTGLLSLETLQRIIENPHVYRERLRTRTRFGARLRCTAIVCPLDSEAANEDFLMLLVDESPQLALHDKLVQSQELSSLGRMLSGLGHEINNPLTGILGYAQLLLEKNPDEESAKHLRHIASETRRCIGIVDRLRAFARQCKQEPGKLDLNGLLRDVATLCDYGLISEQISLTLDLDTRLPAVEANGRELLRIFFNLIDNAQRALEEVDENARMLTVATEKKEDYALIVFEDTGCGIEPDRIARIMDPFASIAETKEEGLGLALARDVVEKLGGALSIRSNRGEGTRVALTLPLPSTGGV